MNYSRETRKPWRCDTCLFLFSLLCSSCFIRGEGTSTFHLLYSFLPFTNIYHGLWNSALAMPSSGKCLTIPRRACGWGQLERTGENRARGIPGEGGCDLKWKDDAVGRLAENSPVFMYCWWPLCLPVRLQDSRVGSLSSRWLLDQKNCSMLMEKALWQRQKDTWIKSPSLQACLKFHFILFHLLFSDKDGF